MLDADARNCAYPLQSVGSPMTDPTVHAWGYRRYVLQSLPESFVPKRTSQDELRYTQKKIEANFSNFSAWHLRTKLLGGQWETVPAEEVMKAKDQGQS